MKHLGDYRNLIVWQKAMDFVVEVYRITEKFPSSELYGLTSQLRRAAVSIPSNIAEGRRRDSENEFRHFVRIAFGSGAEIETQFMIAHRLGFIHDGELDGLDEKISEIMRMLNALSSKSE